ncbi:hypothetical protein G7Y89_g1464 [Cudoniella acicularis]|uniref:Protein kinase domain-containing protein n=1 Tax=Cudoniella acicularis TaxID=354080 RepID=A0A8H4RX09_9HELO|nr:hypothetical protein G7Y89_g1464 [Cudoniella acicularis]
MDANAFQAGDSKQANGCGDVISGGSTGLVYLLDSGYVRKTAYSDKTRKQSLRDIELEYRIYQRLPRHDRLLKMMGYSPESGLDLEYMPNGNLREFLQTEAVNSGLTQRLQWACDAAEALHLLHSHNVIHCDVKPENYLVDSKFRLRIIDFSGSSMDGSYFSALETVRFCLPRPWEAPSTIVTDLFALGSTIYEIMTGMQPYAQYKDEEVETFFRRGIFPPVDNIHCGELIKRCWHGELSNDRELFLTIFDRCDWRGSKSDQALIHIVSAFSLRAYREYPSSSQSGQSSLLLDEPVSFSFKSLPVQSEPRLRAAWRLFVRIKCLIRCPHLWMRSGGASLGHQASHTTAPVIVKVKPSFRGTDRVGFQKSGAFPMTEVEEPVKSFEDFAIDLTKRNEKETHRFQNDEPLRLSALVSKGNRSFIAAGANHYVATFDETTVLKFPVVPREEQMKYPAGGQRFRSSVRLGTIMADMTMVSIIAGTTMAATAIAGHNKHSMTSTAEGLQRLASISICLSI